MKIPKIQLVQEPSQEDIENVEKSTKILIGKHVKIGYLKGRKFSKTSQDLIRNPKHLIRRV
ncbi:unnamed protein product [Meloidogyne enterolobii]|uniref:Uncharacterized protein n=1 Tax=Meloidogyne enterolobii TaxID=390850 RepID=A0ACB0Z233_MELEN